MLPRPLEVQRLSHHVSRSPGAARKRPAPASLNACLQCSVMSVCHAAWTYAMGLRAIMSSVLFVDIM